MYDREMSVPPPVNVHDYETRARERMDPAAYDYYAGGAGDELTRLSESRGVQTRLAASADADRRPGGRSLDDVARRARVDADRAGADGVEPPRASRRRARGRARGRRGRRGDGLQHDRVDDARGHGGRGERAALVSALRLSRPRGHARSRRPRRRRRAAARSILTVDTPRLGRRERDIRNSLQLPAGRQHPQPRALLHARRVALGADVELHGIRPQDAGRLADVGGGRVAAIDHAPAGID